jgi:N-methylhydantoinase A
VSAGYRLGIDVGGTFTDVIVADEQGGVLTALKTPSVPSAPEEGIFNAIGEMKASGVDPALIGLFVHGTTLAVNTLIERSGATTGLLVTAGFRDLLEIRRLRLDDPTNFYGDKPVPLVPRHLVVEVDERLRSDGRVHRPLDAAGVRRAVAALVAEGVTAIAVCFLHSYRNPAHEHQTRDLIRAEWPALFVCASADVWPQQREYERGMVTVMNAYIGRKMARYFDHLVAGAADRGLRAEVLSTKSNGGVMTAARAAEEPVQTLLSGPASGVIGAAYVARMAGYTRLVTLDMGGTSADVAVVDGEPAYSTENQVGDFPVIMPAIDVSSIGAGGGSIAWIDSAGVLKVGPQSAGAEPGPACYARGGRDATVTDAYVHLGIIAPDRFLGGRMPLRAEAAAEALERVGARLHLTSEATAQAILDVATSNMYAQFTPLMARRGVDPRDLVLLAYGGAGPTHAFLFAREVGIRTVLVPPSPGTLCALGCVVADLRSDFVHTIYRSGNRLGDADLERAYADLETQGLAWLARERASGIHLEASFITYRADMRYSGQAFEIEIGIPGHDRGRLASAVERFHRQYHDIFGVSDPGAPVDVINVRATVVGVTAKVAELGPQRSPSSNDGRPAASPRPVFTDHRWRPASVVSRDSVGADDDVVGPAIIEQYDTTVFVPEGFHVRADAQGNLIGEAR